MYVVYYSLQSVIACIVIHVGLQADCRPMNVFVFVLILLYLLGTWYLYVDRLMKLQ